KSFGAILLGASMHLGPAGPPGGAGRSKSYPTDFVDGGSRPEGRGAGTGPRNRLSGLAGPTRREVSRSRERRAAAFAICLHQRGVPRGSWRRNLSQSQVHSICSSDVCSTCTVRLENKYVPSTVASPRRLWRLGSLNGMSSRGGEGGMLRVAFEEVRRLGDFTTKPRVLVVSGIAIGVGTAGAITGLVLLDLIRFFTNIAYFGRPTLQNLSLGASPLGALAVAVPVVGGLIIGLM